MRRTLWVLGAVVACLGGVLFGSTNAEQATQLRVVNGLERYTIYYAYISPGDSRNWGDDKLGSGQTLSPGSSRTWSITAGTYDLRVKDQDDDTYSRYDVCIPRGMTVEWNVTLADLDSRSSSSSSSSATIRITNGLERYTIRYVYISPDASGSWGDDKLGSDVLIAGQSRSWTVDPGVYDLRVKDEDGDTYTRNDIRVGSGETYEWNVALSELDSR